jgi:hypothetical protein
MPPIKVLQDFNVTGVLTGNVAKIDEIITTTGSLYVSSVNSKFSSINTVLSSNSANWDSVYTTFKDASSTFITSTDSQTLSFNDITNQISISNGNSILLPFLSLSGGAIAGGVSFSDNISGANNSHLINFIIDGGPYN